MVVSLIAPEFSMLIKRRSSHHLTEQDVTPEAVYQDRRLILKGLGLSAATLAFPTQASLLDLFSVEESTPAPATKPLNYKAATRQDGLTLTPLEKAISHNNFYELGTDKGIRLATPTTSNPSPGRSR